MAATKSVSRIADKRVRLDQRLGEGAETVLERLGEDEDERQEQEERQEGEGDRNQRVFRQRALVDRGGDGVVFRLVGEDDRASHSACGSMPAPD